MWKSRTTVGVFGDANNTKLAPLGYIYICGKSGPLCELLVLSIFCTHSSMQDLKLDINIDSECCCICVKAKTSALQQHNSNVLCMRVHVFGCAMHHAQALFACARLFLPYNKGRKETLVVI